MLSHVLCGILSYLIGSIPTAFLLVRWRSNIDIRSEGSGNVGALNSFQVTRSKFVGVLVLLLDLLKGVAVVVSASVLFDAEFSFQATAGVAAVAGHNFPVWLKFKGGRGLATAAGVMLLMGWPVVLFWGVLWVAGFTLTKDVNLGNAAASAVEMIGILAAPAGVLGMIFGPSSPALDIKIFGTALFLIILAKHIEPVRNYLRKSETEARNR